MYDSTKSYVCLMDIMFISIGDTCITMWSYLNSCDIIWKNKVAVLVFTTLNDFLVIRMLLKLVLHDISFKPHFFLFSRDRVRYITHLSTKSSHTKILATVQSKSSHNYTNKMSFMFQNLLLAVIITKLYRGIFLKTNTGLQV